MAKNLTHDLCVRRNLALGELSLQNLSERESERFVTCDVLKLEGEFGRDFREQIPGQVADGERRVAHQMIDGIGHLTQLALAQIWEEGRERREAEISLGISR